MNVTRRTAIAAGIAALFAPTVRLRSEIDRERLLNGFLDTEAFVYDHTKPYHLGGWTYATDSRHMAWAELCKPDEDGGQRRIPRIEEARRRCFQPTRWVDLKLPPIASLDVNTNWDGLCPVCGNRRVSFGKFYPTVEWIEKHHERTHYDVDDNTIRDPSCGFCRGGQREDMPSVATVCGMPFSYWRLLPIAAIPGVRVSATEILRATPLTEPSKVLCFEADGIQGVAMGLAETI